MDVRSSKSVSKKQSGTGSEKSTSGKKTQGQKKKKKHRKKSDVKESGKSSTSPEADILPSDVAQDAESDCSTRSSSVIKQKPLHMRRTVVTKYSEAIATLKQNHRKQDNCSPRSTRTEPKSTASTPRVTSTQSSSTAPSKKVSPTANKTVAPAPKKESQPETKPNSLRWEYELSDPGSEEERLRLYKLNRRKRYMAQNNQNYVEWLAEGVLGDGTASLQDIGLTDQPPEIGSPRQRRSTMSKMRSQSKIELKGSVPKISPLRAHNNQDIMIKCS